MNLSIEPHSYQPMVELIDAVGEWAGSVSKAIELIDVVLGGKGDDYRKVSLELRDLMLKYANVLLKDYRPTEIVRELRKHYLSIEQVSRQVSRTKSEQLRKFFEERTSQDRVVVKDDEKRRMVRECPKCCGLIEDGVCKYPVCGVEACERDCQRLEKSRVAARIQNKRKDFGRSNRNLVNTRINEMCNQSPKCGRCDRVWSE